jgi:hypothetical protein
MARAKQDGYAFQSLIDAICQSVPFQKRRGGGFRDTTPAVSPPMEPSGK